MNLQLPRREGPKARPPLYGEPPPIEPLANELDPMDLIRILRRRFWLIVLVGALGFLAALPAILSLAPHFRAETRVLIESPLAASLDEQADPRLTRVNVVTEMERLAAREIGETVIRALGLDRTAEFNPALRTETRLAALKRTARALIYGPEAQDAPRDPMERIFPEYAAALSIARDPSSDVVAIGFVSEDPDIAAAAPPAVLRAYLAEREAALDSQTGEAGRWLDMRLEEQRARVRDAEAAVRAAEMEEGSRLSARADITREIAALMAERSQIARERAELVAALAAIDADADAASIDLPELAALAQELARLERERERLLEIYGERYPAVIAVEIGIEDARAQMAFAIERGRAAFARRLALAGDREADATARLARLEDALAQEDATERTMRDLERTAADERLALEALERRRRALETTRSLPVARIEVLSPASRPLAPSGRGRLFFAAAALVGAGALGVAAAGLAELTDRSVRSLQQVRGVAGLTPAAMIPALPRRVARRLPDRLNPKGEGAYQQAVRLLALAVEQSNGGVAPRSLMATSAAPGEGKTLTATALALEFSQGRGQRVLLIDGDSRNGSVHKLFGVGPGPGLADVLNGRCAFADAVRRTSHAGLDLMPRGDASAAAFEHDIERMVLKPAEAAYDMVILDGPPALASGRALALVRSVERVVLLALWGRTRLTSVELAAERLRLVLRDEALFAINGVRPGRHILYGFRDADLFLPTLRHYQRDRST